MTTARLVRCAHDLRVAPLEINLSEARLVIYVNDFGPEPQTRLGNRLGIGRAAAGRLIDRLEHRGLVARKHDPDDRRVWLVSATRRTAAMRDQISRIGLDVRAELYAGLTRDERLLLAQLLVRLQHNASRVLGTAESKETDLA